MRTKTLILSAVAGFIGCAAALADTNVYSLNAVGYINVTCQPGFTMIANQLNTTNNAIKYLMPNVDTGTGIVADHRISDEQLDVAGGALIGDALLREPCDHAVLDRDRRRGKDPNANGPGRDGLVDALKL